MVREGRGGGVQFFSLMDAYISNFSLLRSLELLEKFVVGRCVNVNLVIDFGSSLGLGL